MPYIGRELDRGNYLKLDDISSSFDGSTTTFNLTNGGNAFYPGSAFSILVVLAGVVQEPEAAYQINQAQITFASAPLAGDQFFCIVLGQALGVNTPANGSVNGTQLAKPFNYDNYFYLNDTTNRVGVGTATPMTPLHVEGTGRFTDLTVTGDLTVEGTTTTLDTVVTEVDKLEVAANNSTVGVAITQSGSGDAAIFMGGNIGIGTDNPDTLLNLFGTGNTTIKVHNNSATAGTYSRLQLLTGGPASSARSEIRSLRMSSASASTNLAFFTTTSGDTSPTERLRITSGGLVGIGITNPDQELHVIGQIKVSDSNYARTEYARNNTNLWSVGLRETDDLFFFRESGGANVIFQHGKVGIGTVNPQSQFEVFGTSPIVRSKHSTSQKYTQINHNGTDGYLDWSSGGLILRGASNAEKLRIETDGQVVINRPSGAIRADNSSKLEVYNSTENLIFVSNSTAATGQHAGIMFGPANNVYGGQIIVTSDEDFSTSANRTAHMAFYTRNNGTASEKLRILSNGGITFNGDTATANALEDYEEGTWTCTLIPNSGFTPTSNTTTGYYTKIGRQVTVMSNAIMTIPSSLGSYVNNSTSYGLAVTGLPFTILNGGSQSRSAPVIGVADNIEFSGGTLSGHGSHNTTQISIFVNKDNGAVRTSPTLTASQSINFHFSFTYFV